MSALVKEHKATKFFFRLPRTSVTPLVSPQEPRLRKNEVYVSALHPGDIVTAPRLASGGTEGTVEKLFVGEVDAVDAAAERLSVTFVSDGVTKDYGWDEKDALLITKTNNLSVGRVLNQCGLHIIGREIFHQYIQTRVLIRFFPLRLYQPRVLRMISD